MTCPDSHSDTLRKVLADLRGGLIDSAAARRIANSLFPTRPAEVTRATKVGDACPSGTELLPENEHAVLARIQRECALIDQAPYQPGQVIGGRYEVSSVHSGGFGLVCLCRQLGPELHARGTDFVALKTPLSRHLATPELRRMFLTEAAHCVALGAHPNLVLAYGVEQHNRLPFLVLECIPDARDLAGQIFARATDWRTALRVGIGIARGLAFAGLVHGDLKPANILLGPDWAPKVADFGLSLHADDDADGLLAGTRGFMAPEMFLGQPGRTIATDIYAFGVTLFAAATGHLPFRSDDHTPGAAPDPRSLCAEIPAAFAGHLLCCLERDPGLRPASFAEIARDLAQLHQGLLGCDPPDDPPPDAPARARAQVNLAQTWLNLGQADKALAAARDAVAAHAGNWQAHNALGLVLLATAPAAAAQHFGAAAALAPGEVAPLANSALAWSRADQGDRARQHLARAVRLARATNRCGELDPVSQLAIELLPERDAYDVVHAVLAAHPTAAMTWNNRAVLMRRMGAPEIALESADRALALNPTYGKACVQKANALLELGRSADALAAADCALVLDPCLAGAHAAKGSALAALGRISEARAAVEHGLALLPNLDLLLRLQRALQ